MPDLPDLPDWVHTVLRVKNFLIGGLLLVVIVAKIVEEWRRDRHPNGGDAGGIAS